jgi:hypothetical protein
MILTGVLSKVKTDRTTGCTTAQVRCNPDDRQFYVLSGAGPLLTNGRRIRFLNSRMSPGTALLVEILPD